jgi:hypothetical protein
MKKIIGLTGVATVGKDTFFKLASEILMEKYGKISTRLALADELKSDIDGFLMEKTGISALTTNKHEKSIIRPLLVEYGRIQREMSQAKYWTNKLTKQIHNDSVSDYIFITDIRYTVYPEDELFWLKQKMNGTLIHISRYTTNKFGQRDYVMPPNRDEAENDPILKEHADFKFQWANATDKNENVNYDKLKEQVELFITNIL